ncbi:uncharacterized protein LOC112139845 [Oryzias melastigma]|uniref:uncharacterized protein LOC112139845 n=1 Tax=Oryzias melastigma TaxID=30732 RepID=UPI000CF826C2|nr:uncharacterized protein LOC112139845 [Oryzias melastigma]
MSDGEEGLDRELPGPSQAGSDAAAPLLESGNQILHIQRELCELSRKHDAVMSSLASLSDVQPRSIVYIPREKQIVPFHGDPGKDVHSVDEFIEEVERTMSLRGLKEVDQVDFILSHVKGPALEEVKLRTRGQTVRPSELFLYLREAFREKRTTPQLLHTFYARRQLEGENLRDYSHALSQLLNSALLNSPGVVIDPQLAIRDQFIEGVRDSTLRRELRRLIREKPMSSLFDVREEAIMWTLEDQPKSSTIARSRNLIGDTLDGHEVSARPPTNTETDLAVTLQEVVKIIAQQGKAIGELTNAVHELTTQNAPFGAARSTNKSKVIPRYTDDGQPICLKCEGVGHMARQCTALRNRTRPSTSPAAAVQGNENPRLLGVGQCEASLKAHPKS